MDFGVTFPSRVGDFELIELAERLGYRQAWFYDSQMIYSDVYATMALAAHKTSTIRLGTGVAVPTTRLAPTIAHSIATINQLAPGRVELGVGTGNTARLTMGLRPISLTRMKKEVRLIQTLLTGETGTLQEEGEEHAVRFLHPHRSYINLKDPVTVSISALGPKTLAYCGSESDGHITWGIDPDGLRAARAIIDDAARKHGKSPGDVPSKCFFPTAVLSPGETTATPAYHEPGRSVHYEFPARPGRVGQRLAAAYSGGGGMGGALQKIRRRAPRGNTPSHPARGPYHLSA